MDVYLVGGAVRDAQLGLPVTDRDWVVVGATVEMLLAQGYTQVGRDFPVFLHPQSHEEYALARTERKTASGHRGFVVHAGQDVTLEEDLTRRDLTINAIAQTPDGELIDPFGGLDDLAERRLRHVSPAFQEDPLRVFRVARFAALLPGFSVAPATLSLMTAMCRDGALQELSAERVAQEVRKTLRKGGDMAVFLALLASVDGLRDWLPEWLDQAVPKISAALEDEVLRYAALCTVLSAVQIEALSERLKLPREHGRLALLYERWASTLGHWQTAPLADLHTALEAARAYREPLILDALAQVVNAQEQVDLSPLLAAVQTVATAVSAKQLIAAGAEPGPALGAALSRARCDLLETLRAPGSA